MKLNSWVRMFVFTTALAVSATALAQGHAYGHDKHGKDKGRDDDHGKQAERYDDHGRDHRDARRYYADDNRQYAMRWRDDHRNRLPPGLAKKDRLPPGLQRQLEERGTLPPGLAKKIYPVPVEWERRLPPPPPDCRHVIIGGNIVLLNRRSNVVVDIMALF